MAFIWVNILHNVCLLGTYVVFSGEFFTYLRSAGRFDEQTTVGVISEHQDLFKAFNLK